MSWADQAACCDVSPDVMLAEDTHGIAEAKRVCERCPAKQPCLEEAMARPTFFRAGVRGGLSGNERRKRRRVVTMVSAKGPLTDPRTCDGTVTVL